VDATDLLLVGMRWLHTVAAVAWIGSVVFELLALGPAFSGAAPPEAQTRIDAAMREIVQSSLVVFLLSGAILTFERLSYNVVGTAYVSVLGLKIVLAVAMVQIAFRSRRSNPARRTTGSRWVLALGITILFLAALLKSIFERSLVP
jgi:putative copper export protein